MSDDDATLYQTIRGMPIFARRSAAIRIAREGLSEEDWGVCELMAKKFGMAVDEIARIVESECREIKHDFDDQMRRDAEDSLLSEEES